jgi:hypothetical protein
MKKKIKIKNLNLNKNYKGRKRNKRISEKKCIIKKNVFILRCNKRRRTIKKN